MSIPIDTIKARTYYDDDAEVVLDPTVSYVDNGTPKCSQDDLEQKDYMVVGEAYNGVRADVLETSNRNVPFLNLLPEYLSDFQYSELYKFFDCYLNTMYELERDQEVHTGDKHHYMAKEVKGCRIQQMPSLSDSDKWHRDSGYVHSIRAALLLGYNKEKGKECEFEKRI